ncbi:lysozyme inhibitor LprI family protein [Geminicoccus roseus]|uniref:hypothetical protein n=1 Tax=Geminicoccus roseus TaxID=404900 RepID=UPI000411918A|nr:hypothetical protein [Geminicoccus roseus]
MCASPELAALDGELRGLDFAYGALPAKAAPPDQASFRQERAACGEKPACLRDAYQARIALLQERIRTSLARLGEEPAPAAADGLPPRVAATLAGYADRCRRLGGGLVDGGSRPVITSRDFDEDGVTDYLLDTRTLDCTAPTEAFCGEGGCRIDIAVSSEKFQPITTTGSGPEVFAGGIDVAISVPDAHCPDLADGQGCWLIYDWHDGRRVQRHEARPRSE